MLDLAGAGVSVVKDVSNGDVDKAATTALTNLLFGALGKKVEKLKDAEKITGTDNTILQAVLYGASKVSDKAVDVAQNSADNLRQNKHHQRQRSQTINIIEMQKPLHRTFLKRRTSNV